MTISPGGSHRVVVSARRLRLASGLVLFTYIVLHLFNHALALWSLPAADSGLGLAIALWQSPPGTVLLYGAAAVHVGLAVRTIYLRSHWRLPPMEIIRLWAGFSLPLLLIRHFVTTRVAVSLYHVHVDYGYVVRNLVATGTQGWQIALLAPGWVHGCLGLWISLRTRPGMQRLRPYLLGFVVLVPLLSAGGFARMAEILGNISPIAPVPGNADVLGAWQRGLFVAYLGLLAGAVAAGQLRKRFQRS